MKKIKIRILACVFFMLAILAGGILSPVNLVNAFAAETAYSAVLDDLKRDDAFKSSEYPVVTDTKYSVQVIQIAEGTAGELFVYTYQPSVNVKKLTATTVSISTAINEDYAPKLYKLQELSSQGVFGKYLVKDFKVKSDPVRYYDIATIYRAWDSSLDDPAPSGETVTEVAFAVGKLYTARTENGAVSYECTDTETIEIIDPFHGSLRYKNGMTFPFATSVTSNCDSWFIAFSTDKQIDRLMAATVYCVAREYTTHIPSVSSLPTDTQYGENQEQYINVTDKEKASNNPHLWIKGEPRNWDRIQSVSKFVETEDLTTETKAALAGKQWVLRFLETEYKETFNTAWGMTDTTITGTEISDVSILRLKFETDGTVYNLGAVDNKSTPDTTPDNIWDEGEKSYLDRLWDYLVDFFTGKSPWWVYVVVAIAVLILLPTILGLLIPAVGKAFIQIVTGIVKAVWWIISAPFRLIACIIAKSKEKRKGKDKK